LTDKWIIRHSNHLSVHRWICSAIRDSQQPISPVYRFLIFVASATALCGTVGIILYYIKLYHTSSTRTRRGGSCLKDIYIYIYKTLLIYRTCMRRAPAKQVRACTLRNWCLVSHVTVEAPRHTSHLTVFALHTAHFTLHPSHCTLRSQHFTSHCTLKTPHFTLHTPHFTLHTSHCTLRTPNFTLHSPHFTLLTSHCFLHTPNFTLHTSHCTLHTPHFISSELFAPHPSSSLLISSHLFSYVI